MSVATPARGGGRSPARPVMTAPVRTAMPMGESGYATYGSYGGGGPLSATAYGWVNWDPFEKVPTLQWPESVLVYLDMDNDDSRVTSLLESLSLPIVSTKWRVEPNGAPTAVVEHVSKCLNVPVVGQDNVDNGGRSRGRFSWVEHLALVASPTLQFGHCVDYDTEVLTSRGWLNGRDLRIGDQVMTLNLNTGLGEWQHCDDVMHFPGRHTVRRLEGRSHSSVSTLNHRWITRDYHSGILRFRSTERLNTNDRIIRAAPTSNLAAEPKWSDQFVELVAWYFTEGQELAGGGAAIRQSDAVNSWHCQRIREVLWALFGPPRASLRDKRGGWREQTRIGGVNRTPITYWYISKVSAQQLRQVAPGKVVDGRFIAELTASQLRLFIETSIDADGNYGRGGARYLAQRDPRRLDAFQMACSLLGIPWTSGVNGAGMTLTRTGKQLECRPVANAARTQRGANTSDTISETNGVWCLQVPNRTWLARRRGTVYFTGNSVFEQVYRREADNRVVIRKLGPRPQWTIQRFNTALDGGLDSVTQVAPMSSTQTVWGIAPLDLAINRLVVYTRNMRPGFWQGRSILRSGYKHWLLKNELLKIEVAVARRNGMGVPVGTASRPDNAAEVDAMRKIASGFRGGLHAGVGLAQGQTLALLGVSGNLPDIRAGIEYHDKSIALAGLIHFMNLDKGGSYALANVLEKPYTQALNATAAAYAHNAQQHIIEDLVDLEFGTDVRCPLLTFEPIGSDMAIQFLAPLVAAGLLTPDLRVERALRQSLDLPSRPEPGDPDYEPPPKPSAPAPAQPGPPAPSPGPNQGDPNQQNGGT